MKSPILRSWSNREANGMKTLPEDQHVRLNRYLSMCGVASRRKADEFILQGRVRVNRSVVADLGTKIDTARDRVEVDGRPILLVRDQVYLVLNKPKDTISTLHDERGRKTVVGLITTRHRVYPVGRLDRNTTGVLLLTNDGEFANSMMHPRFEIPKTYRVTCGRPVAPHHLRTLMSGLPLDGRTTARTDAIIVPRSHGKEVLITLHEGRNRQVRRMFESLGYVVEKLDRVAYGPITHEGLGRGETRALNRREVRKLLEMAGKGDSR